MDNVEQGDDSLKYVIIGMIAAIVILTPCYIISHYQDKPITSTQSPSTKQTGQDPSNNKTSDFTSNTFHPSQDNTNGDIHTDTMLRYEHVGHDPANNPVPTPAYEYFNGISKKAIYEFICD